LYRCRNEFGMTLFINQTWNDILLLNSQNKLVNVYLNRIEAIN